MRCCSYTGTFSLLLLAANYFLHSCSPAPNALAPAQIQSISPLLMGNLFSSVCLHSTAEISSAIPDVLLARC